MAKFSVQYRVTGYLTVDVEAPDRAKAVEQADLIVNEHDFGEVEDVVTDILSVNPVE